MDDVIQISKLNDYIFCPYSMYLHTVFDNFGKQTFHRSEQIRGSIKHELIDQQQYSTSKQWLQGKTVYSEHLKLIGKVDLFNTRTRELIERKYKISKIFDGQRYQLYAQKICLEEMGYQVASMRIHSLVDNKNYRIKIPSINQMKEFFDVLVKIREFDAATYIHCNPSKCRKCVYSTLCTISDLNNANTT